jgi:hypothetical protein
MSKTRPTTKQQEEQLMHHIWSPELADDPVKFVKFVFPWEKQGTPLARFKGPRQWQEDELNRMRDHIFKNLNLMALGKMPKMYKSATTSGRGPGKSALTSWLTYWMMSTRVGSTTIVTANTEQQLKSRTWAELGHWHTLAINEHWFDRSAMKLSPQPWFEEELKTKVKIDTGYYYAQAQLWAEERPDAFAGVHNHKGVMVLFDEASGIPSPIWKVTEGFFTEPILDRYHFAFSNPRRNTGEFFECFHKNREFWNRRQIDSRTVEGLDKEFFDQQVAQHGEDSDHVRVEIKGEFPKQGDRQFISRSVIEAARTRELEPDTWAPLIMGVDPARFGDDSTVIRFRQGRNGKVIPPTKMKGADNMQVANQCAHLISTYNPDAVCIDAGNGTGIIDRLKEMGYKVHEVWFGGGSPEPEYANMRTYIWAQMRDWLNGAVIDDDSDLIDDLAAPEYKFQGTSDRIMLESKEQLKSRGFASPDNADALACTFSIKVARKDISASRAGPGGQTRVARDVDYNMFE